MTSSSRRKATCAPTCALTFAMVLAGLITSGAAAAPVTPVAWGAAATDPGDGAEALGTATDVPTDVPTDVMGRRGSSAPVPPKPPLVSLSEELGVADFGARRIDLAPPADIDTLLDEDRRAAEWGNLALRISAPIDHVVFPEDGALVRTPGGTLRLIELRAAGAYGLRIHFTEVDLPKGARITITGALLPQFVIGPYSGLGPGGDGEFWSSTIEGDVARIEYFLPTGASGGNAKEPFAIDEVQYVYRDIFQRGGDGGGAGVGECHNDPVCFPAWEDVADSVAKINFIEGGFGFSCTGELLNTVTNDETPYFVTANHCISTDSVAETTDFRFRHQRVECGGVVISPGYFCTQAQLIDTFATADHSLLLVDGTLPSSPFFSGWSVTAMPNALATGIHHPGGSYKRISFCARQATPNCGGSSTNYQLANWYDAVVEQGSSGSGLWRDSNQLLYGVLSCGASDCDTPNFDDSYGRFDRAYTSAGGGGFSIHLGSGTDDVLENNDSCAGALALSSGTFSALVVKSTDEDWYEFDLDSGAAVSVSVDFVHANGDVDLALFATCGGSSVASSTSQDDDEAIAYTNTSGSTVTYALRVFLAADTRNDYSMILTVGDAPPVNDDCADATLVTNGTFPFTNIGATLDGPIENTGDCIAAGDALIDSDVWFRYTSTCLGTLTISACGSGFNTKMALYQGNCPTGDGQSIACDDNGCGNQSVISLVVLSGTTYRIRLGGHLGAEGNGALTIDCDPFVLPQGACCFTDGSCAVEMGSDCTGAGGVYQGDSTACSPSPCPPPSGACCFGDGSCTIDESGPCASAGGAYQGTGTDCTGNPCPPACPGDFDRSGDVGFGDLTDLLIHWGTCPVGPCPWDLDESGNVGFGDLTELLIGWGPC